MDANSYQKHAKQYRKQALSNATPDELIAKVYDLVVTSCERGDYAKARAGLTELIVCLDEDPSNELAGGLCGIYEFCIQECRAEGDLELVIRVMGELRDAWYEGVLDREMVAA